MYFIHLILNKCRLLSLITLIVIITFILSVDDILDSFIIGSVIPSSPFTYKQTLKRNNLEF